MNTRHTWRRLTAITAVISFTLFPSPAARADAYDGSPKLAILLVFDQFRGDYLDRYRADFQAKNGWNLFLKQGRTSRTATTTMQTW